MIIKKQLPKKEDKKNNNEAQPQASADALLEQESKIDLFDIDNIDFSQRAERRRGDRRRGYRRIDDRNLISRAQEEAGSIRESAAKEGYRTGLEQAQADLASVKDSLVAFFDAKNQVFDSIAPDILEISIDIARKIVKKEIAQDPNLILETITDVLKGVSKEESKVTLKVSPEDLHRVRESLPEMISNVGIDARVSVFSDEAVSQGGCVLYTNNGVVDASIETQLEIIKESLKGI